MNYDSKIDDRILENILLRTDATSAKHHGALVDEADEWFALMLEKGQLDEHEQEHLMRCLDASPEARRAVSRFLATSAGDLQKSRPASAVPERAAPKTAPRPSRASLGEVLERLWQQVFGYPTYRRVAYAFALLMLATIGWLWVSSSPGPLPAVAMLTHPNVFDLGFDPAVGFERGQPSAPQFDASTLFTGASAADREQLSAAYRDLRTNHLPEAREKFEAVLNREPGSYFAHLGLATAFFMENRQADFEQALTHFQEALDIQQGSTAAQIGLAAALSQLGRDEEALVHWQAALTNKDLAAEQRKLIEGQIQTINGSNK